MGTITKLDLNILEFIQNNFHNHILDKIMPLITLLGDSSCFWIIIGVVLIATKKYRKIGILTILTVILCTVLGGGIIKNIVQRPRPFLEVSTVEILISKPVDYSFPSIHTAVAFAVSGVLFKTIKKYGVVFIFLAVLIAFSRLYLFVHYPSDVIAGVILGLLCTKIVLYFSKKSNFFHY